MALRRFGGGPSESAALRETEKATAERDAEARAACEATFKRAHRVPPTLAPTGRREGRRRRREGLSLIHI